MSIPEQTQSGSSEGIATEVLVVYGEPPKMNLATASGRDLEAQSVEKPSLAGRGVRDFFEREHPREGLHESGSDRLPHLRDQVEIRLNSVRREFGFSADALVVSTIGALHPRKSHELFIEAAARVIPR